MIQFKKIGKKIGKKTLLENINIEIKKSEIIGLIGKNGAGKTTLMKIFFNQLKITSGEYIVDNNILSSNHYIDMAFFSDLNNIPLDIKVSDFFLLNKLNYGITTNHYNERIKLLLSKFNADNVMKEKIKNLSSGWKKKILLIATLLKKPKIIFFDEPTANLDVESRIELLQIIKEINKLGVTIVISSHIIEELEGLVNRWIIMDDGKIICDSSIIKADFDIRKYYNNTTEKRDLSFIKELLELTSIFWILTNKDDNDIKIIIIKHIIINTGFLIIIKICLIAKSENILNVRFI